MSKVVLLMDTHLGVRNDSDLFANHQKKFFYDVLFPYMKENKLKRILQAGDLGDKRSGICTKTKHFLDGLFSDSYGDYGIYWDLFPGNHDQYYRNNGELTLQSENYRNTIGVTVHLEPSTIKLSDTCSMDLFPWINPEDKAHAIEYMSKSDSEYALGHFEFSGFDMYKGVPAQGGMSHKVFSDNYKKVFSGHFHTMSNQDNVYYLGTPYDLTWSDYGDIKGFHVFDTKTGETEFVENPNNLHHKIEYDSTKDYSDFDFEQYEGKIIKFIVVDRTNQDAMDVFWMQLTNANPADIKVIDSDFGDMTEDVDVESLDIEDTLSILFKAVDHLSDENIDKDELKAMIGGIYNESVAIGNEV